MVPKKVMNNKQKKSSKYQLTTDDPSGIDVRGTQYKYKTPERTPPG